MDSQKKLDAYFGNQKIWKNELLKLRAVLTSLDLSEDYKWNSPVYTYEGKNLIGIGSFKNYFALWFFQGVLLKDVKKVLVNAQEGKRKH
jgi:uncharacterized protein YdeI (YjbR/CyaY-like superfamily)